MIELKETTKRPFDYYISQGGKVYKVDEKQDLLAQVDKALQYITCDDYQKYIKYLEANNEQKALEELAPKDNSIVAFSQYLYEFLDSYLIESETYKRKVTFTYIYTMQRPEISKVSAITSLIAVILDIAYQIMRCIKNIQGDIIGKLMSVRTNTNNPRKINTDDDFQKITDKYTYSREYGAYTMQYKDGKNTKIAYTNMKPGTKLVLTMLTGELARILPNEVFNGSKKNDFMKYATVIFTTDKYMDYTHRTDRKNANSLLNDYLQNLYDSKIFTQTGTETYTDENGKKKRRPLGLQGRWIESFDNAKKRQGIYAVTFTYNFMRWICSRKAFIHDFNTTAYALTDKQTVEVSLFFKLWHNYMSRQGEKGDNVITVEKLLYLDGLPFMDDVLANKKDGHLTAKFRKPIEKALNTLQDIAFLTSWHYVDKSGNVITDTNVDFSTWQKWSVVYNILLPPQNKYIEQHRQSKARRLKQAEYRQFLKEKKIQKCLAEKDNGL